MAQKRILMIGTGGTIASRETAEGLAPGLSTEDVLSYIPAVKDVCRVDTAQPFSIDSTNMTPEHWLRLARVLEEQYDAYDGFVVCHGTDTLAYTAAALSYMVQGSAKPIVLTGAQKPIDQDSTDARANLLDSFAYAASETAQDVTIVFDGKVIAGTRAKKERAKSYNAFSSINFPYLAVIQDGRVVPYVPSSAHAPDAVRFFHALHPSVYVLKLIPGLGPEVLEWLFVRYDCIVIESFGVGGIPQALLAEFYEEMRRWAGKGKHVVMATQVANEGSNMTVYEVGKQVKRDFRLLEAYDMTLEAVITKMMWLMAACGPDYEAVRQGFYRRINHDILFTS